MLKMTSRMIAVGMLSCSMALLAAATVPDIKRSTSESLGGAERYLTFVSTDKPIYRPGERVYVRGVRLHATTHKPAPADTQFYGLVEIRGPRGEHVSGGYTTSQDSVLAFAWDIPEEQAGGPYVVKITDPYTGQPPAERSFDIRSYRAPRLKTQIEFLRDGYGPGDTVRASLHVDRAEGGVPDGAKVTVIARIDGAEAHRSESKVDTNGNCTARFDLPKKIARGEGTLAMVIEDGGVVETASKTIPILLQTLDLSIYPESGELIAGLPTRVYVEARTPNDKPADIVASVVDDLGATVATFKTEHEGRGRFNFTPQPSGRYELHIAEPTGIRTTFPLPEVKDQGAVVRSVADVIEADDAVQLRVGGIAPMPLTVTLSQRESTITQATVAPAPGMLTDVIFTAPDTVDGVLIATVYDANGKPLAERLVFRTPKHPIAIEITPDREQYTPGDAASFTVTTKDDNGSPISAVVGLTVTDDSILEMIEKREQAPRLPVMVFLEPEAREIADAHVYLDETNPEAPLAIDLLLGTQGWRRFAFHHAEDFMAQNEDAGLRVLAYRSPHPEYERGFVGRGGLREKGVEIGEDAAVINFGVAVRDADAALPPLLAALVVEEHKLGADDKNVPVAEVLELAKQDRSAKRHREQPLARRRLFANAKDAELNFAKQEAMVAVREYAHQLRTGRQPTDRVDFSETLYWHAGVRTDAKTGQAKVRFALSDAVTSFRIFADAVNDDGHIGQGGAVIESVKPFYIEPKLPLEVTAGDSLIIPVGVVSNMQGSGDSVTIEVDTADGVSVEPVAPITLDANNRGRGLVHVNVDSGASATTLTIRGESTAQTDVVTRPLVIKPLGFPVELAHGGVLTPNDPTTHEIVITENVVAGSVKATITVYPTPLSNMTSALERLIREPHGCFEQTSSTSYPLVMAQQYFLTHSGVDPQLIARSVDNLQKSYAKLTGFECSKKGYEWFGQDPGHEALTAYGLMQFCDMAKVRDVDAAMIERTRQWLLKTRDGKGGFTRGRRALHTWIEDRNCSNGYILWALLKSGETGLEKEVAAFREAAESDANSYVTALAANIMTLAGDKAPAKRFMDRLAERQNDSGWIDGATTSIVGSGGEALNVETTALAVLAWLHDPAYTASVEKGVRSLFESCKAGRFGSTQSTVLALQAIVAYDRSRARPKAAGAVTVLHNGQPVGEPVAFNAETQGEINCPDIAGLLTPGTHTITLRMDDGSDMPYAVTVEFFSTQLASSDQCALDLKVKLSDEAVAEGEVTEAVVTVHNRTDAAIPTPVAIVGLPGGLEPRHDQLKELVKSEKIAAYEVIGREVVLYWRGMGAGQSVEIPLALVAAIPGQYTGPASRAYLYYTDEFKTWTAPIQVNITPSGENGTR
ncbi:MAG TPA: MG2 domain-containing protein [Phycisphaerae bacterium]|nr:MG2 domain-containing protein [Phycisphaerae bacterium]